MTSTTDTGANYAAVARLAGAAAAAGCSMLFLPEAFAFLGPNPAATVAAAQPLTGPLMARYRALAAATGLWLSLGGFQEAGAPPEDGGFTPRCFNTHVVVDDKGGLVAAYRKVHLFDAEGLRESACTAPGSEGGVVVQGTPCGALGLSICFDLRFALFFDDLQFSSGLGTYAVRVLAIPAAFTLATGANHWDLLLRARAVETQSAVVAAAQAGRHNENRVSYGHAVIFDAWGNCLARVGGEAPEDETALHAEGLAIADVGEDAVEAVRMRMPLAAARARGRAVTAAMRA